MGTSPPENERLGAKKRGLRLNGAGGLGSPRKSRRDAAKQHDAEGNQRPRKKGIVPASRITIMRYGALSVVERNVIGDKINNILGSSTAPAAARMLQNTPVTTAAINSSKCTHPFFASKASAKIAGDGKSQKEVSEAKQTQNTAEPVRRSFTTPVKPQLTRDAPHDHTFDTTALLPPSAPFRRLRGNPHAPLPWQELRNVTDTISLPANSCAKEVPAVNSQKKKRKRDEIEGVALSWWCASKSVQDAMNLHRPTQPEYPPQDSFPTRLVETEQSFKEKLCHRLGISERCRDSSERSSGTQSVAAISSHSALRALYDVVGDQQHAFDRGVCENRLWLQKYAPKKADQILQSPPEIGVLRSWLAGLTVDAVETRVQRKLHSESELFGAAAEPRRRKKRRKRSEDDLDGFLVSSDDEEGSMQALSDRDITGALDKHIQGTRSVVRSTDASIAQRDPRQPMNAILLSGPSGCGKTAAAYAVAAELGFSVFEINSATRRSGKDLLDRVGDMSMNHQVKKADAHPEHQPSESESELPQVPEAGQNTLVSFFAAGSKRKMVKKSSKLPKPPKDLNAIKRPPRPQKQSLILLEEVDILFEDDKQFWETVVELAKHSRRPIIMTCNDESNVPLSLLSLHAILRLQPPPVDLATTYLCLVAAAEGHLIDPIDAESLYSSTSLDLRSSISQLGFWCQMAVGSEKAGLDWYLRRWPVGIDLNSSGQRLHVVSDRTYTSNLTVPDSADATENTDEGAWQAWTQWGTEPLLHADEVLHSPNDEIQTASSSSSVRQRHIALERFDRCLDILSVSDSLSKVDYPCHNDNLIDTSIPPISAAARSNYVADLPVFSADEQHDLHSVGAKIYTSLCAGGRRCYTDISGILTGANKEMSALPTPKKPSPGMCHRLGGSRLEQSGLAFALDALIEDVVNPLCPAPYLATDIAPYARSIVAYDLTLEQYRADLAKFLDDGKGERLRKTRASRSALEGSQRANTRRERWFDKSVDHDCILRTAGTDWPRVEADLFRHKQDFDADSVTGSDADSRLPLSQSTEGE